MELKNGSLRGCVNTRANENPWDFVKSRASSLWKLEGSTCVNESYLDGAEMHTERQEVWVGPVRYEQRGSLNQEKMSRWSKACLWDKSARLLLARDGEHGKGF